MMKILYYDCFSGISGDMNLAAMLNLEVPEDYLIDELKKLKLEGYHIATSEASRKGIFGTMVDVAPLASVAPLVPDPLGSGTKGGGDDDHHHHHHHHEHRGLLEIENIINSSELNDNVKKLSLDIFKEVAKAEAKVHNKPLYEVHFHEVGAVDSIIDTVGAAICLDYLKVDKVMCSKIELGGGFVNCAHGLIPVPAPAVVEILKDVPVTSGAVQFETTTPTGAAILKATVDEFTDRKDFKIQKVAYGIGHRDTEIPNVLRLILAEDSDAQNTSDKEKAYMVECNIDDMNAEMYDYIIEKLFNIGASDAFLTPIIMKKGRPAVKINALTKGENLEAVKAFILKETSTLGIRYYEVEKTMLNRDFTKLETKYGLVTIKNGYYEGKKIKSKPEYSECKKIAVENGIALKEVYDEINKNIK